MVVIKQYSDTQINSLNSITGRVLYDSTLNALRFNDSSSYNNILLFKDSSNNVTGINNVRTSGNFGINTSTADKQAEINSATGGKIAGITNAASQGLSKALGGLNGAVAGLGNLFGQNTIFSGDSQSTQSVIDNSIKNITDKINKSITWK